MSVATFAAPKPLSMLTTETFDAQLVNIPSSAARPHTNAWHTLANADLSLRTEMQRSSCNRLYTSICRALLYGTSATAWHECKRRVLVLEQTQKRRSIDLVGLLYSRSQGGWVSH